MLLDVFLKQKIFQKIILNNHCLPLEVLTVKNHDDQRFNHKPFFDKQLIKFLLRTT